MFDRLAVQCIMPNATMRTDWEMAMEIKDTRAVAHDLPWPGIG
jgi:hypothetical protein